MITLITHADSAYQSMQQQRQALKESSSFYATLLLWGGNTVANGKNHRWRRPKLAAFEFILLRFQCKKATEQTTLQTLSSWCCLQAWPLIDKPRPRFDLPKLQELLHLNPSTLQIIERAEVNHWEFMRFVIWCYSIWCYLMLFALIGSCCLSHSFAAFAGIQ